MHATLLRYVWFLPYYPMVVDPSFAVSSLGVSERGEGVWILLPLPLGTIVLLATG